MSIETNIERKWSEMSKEICSTIVLPEAGFSERMVLAGIKAAKDGVANIILLTDKDDAFDNYDLASVPNIKVVNTNTDDIVPLITNALYIKRKDKGLSLEDAKVIIKNPIYFGTVMVDLGLADGMVAGAETSTANTFRPSFQIIKGKDKDTKISSFFVLIKKDGEEEKIFLLSDCGVNVCPNTEEVVEIAKQTAETARNLCFMEPIMALLSYSTKGSAEGEGAVKMRTANEILQKEQVDFVVDGELQLDAAIVPEVSNLKCPDSPVAGKANTLIFPDLQSGNIGYKLIQRFGGYHAVGPISQGLRKPINDVSRGANVDEIVQAIAITVIQSK